MVWTSVLFLNCHLEMTVNDYKVKRLLELLNTEWSAGRISSMVLTGAVLIGNVYTATLICTWLRLVPPPANWSNESSNQSQLSPTCTNQTLQWVACGKRRTMVRPANKQFCTLHLPQSVNYKSSVAVPKCLLSHQSHSHDVTLHLNTIRRTLVTRCAMGTPT